LAGEIDGLYGSGRVIYGGAIKHDFASVPFIDEWFRKGIQLSRSTFVCFINSDIILSANWLIRAKQVFRLMADRPILVIDQRINFHLNQHLFQNLTFDESLLQQIDVMVKKSPHFAYQATGMDMFLFRIDRLQINPERIPPFIMGKPYWDNWLVGYFNDVSETITFSLNPPIYHITHRSQWGRFQGVFCFTESTLFAFFSVILRRPLWSRLSLSYCLHG
jgi:hypothetical protein